MLILIPLFLLSCIAYTSWRFWLILPLSPLGKTLAVAVYLLCFTCVFLHYGLGNKLPIGVATVTYEIGTSWMIFFLYALLIFLALGFKSIEPIPILKSRFMNCFAASGLYENPCMMPDTSG